MAQSKRGALIVLEGLDRAGKTTQCQRLADNLRAKGHEVRSMRFPDRTTPIGVMIDQYLKGASEVEDHVIHLLFSANRWEAAARIRAELEAGTTVLIDRYIHSGQVYSAAKHNPTLSLDWARSPDVGLPCPDVVVFLEISPEEARKRGGFGDEKYERTEMQARVRTTFEQVRRQEADMFRVVDGGKTADLVQDEILEAVESVVQDVSKQGLPIRTVGSWPQS